MSTPLTYGITPDPVGRGAWRLTGGLLRVKPTSTSTAGYYRLAAAGEAPVGSTWLTGKDRSDAARSVCLGVMAGQRLYGMTGADVDGWHGPATDKMQRAAQTRLGIDADGIGGRVTFRALLAPLYSQVAAESGVPLWALGGISAKESSLDPAAVGTKTPYDHGLFQINLSPTAHGSNVAIEQAMDPWFAARWTAGDLRRVYDRWNGLTKADPYEVAVLHHNSPRNASLLARTGEYPTEQARRYVHGGTYTDSTGRTVTEIGVRQAWEASA